MKNAKWENWVSLILGVWFFLTPWTIGSALSSAAHWNAWLVGAGIALSAYYAIRDLKPWEEWVNIALGVWVFFSPWTFGYQGNSTNLWSSIVVGLGVAVLSGLALPVARRLHHGKVG